MNLAWISIAALVVAVALSCTTAVNVGVLSLAMAWVVGVYLGGMSLETVLEGFPTALLVTLVGVTLLFSMAETNGTLARVTGRAVRLCRGNAGLLPVIFFGLGLVIASIGPGGTPTSALLAPPAMAVAYRAGVPPLLMAIMAGNGALAGTLSPFAPTGIVANSVMRRIGLGGVEWETYAYNALAHTLVGFGGFLALGGWRLFRKGRAHDAGDGAGDGDHRHETLADARGYRRPHRGCRRIRHARGHDGVVDRRGAHLASNRGRAESHQAHAVGRDCHGHRRQCPDRAAGKNQRHGPLCPRAGQPCNPACPSRPSWRSGPA